MQIQNKRPCPGIQFASTMIDCIDIIPFQIILSICACLYVRVRVLPSILMETIINVYSMKCGNDVVPRIVYVSRPLNKISAIQMVMPIESQSEI